MDSFTLILATAISSFLMATSLFAFYCSRPSQRALLVWSGAGTGFLINHLFGIMAHCTTLPFLMVPGLTNLSNMAAHLLIWAGIRLHLGLAAPWRRVIAVLFVTAALHLFPAVQQDIATRLLVNFTLLIAIDVTACVDLWRYRELKRQKIYWPLFALLSLFASQLTVRSTLMLSGIGTDLTFLGSQWMQSIGSIALLLFIPGVTMACALLVVRQQATELERQSRTDPLTGCLNRRALQQDAQHAEPYALLLLDLDFFKQINDHYGHDAGDAALVFVTKRLQQVAPTWYRIGGEEFVLLVQSHTPHDVLTIATRCREQIASTAMPWQQQQIQLTVSIGVSLSHADLSSALRAADVALYAAKTRGRNQVQVAEELLQTNHSWQPSSA